MIARLSGLFRLRGMAGVCVDSLTVAAMSHPRLRVIGNSGGGTPRQRALRVIARLWRPAQNESDPRAMNQAVALALHRPLEVCNHRDSIELQDVFEVASRSCASHDRHHTNGHGLPVSQGPSNSVGGDYDFASRGQSVGGPGIVMSRQAADIAVADVTKAAPMSKDVE